MQQHNFLDQAEPAERKGEYELPKGGEVRACLSCGAQIVFARTANERWIPLSLATAQHRDGKTYVLPHFYDCPDAKDWSKR